MASSAVCTVVYCNADSSVSVVGTWERRPGEHSRPLPWTGRHKAAEATEHSLQFDCLRQIIDFVQESPSGVIKIQEGAVLCTQIWKFKVLQAQRLG